MPALLEYPMPAPLSIVIPTLNAAPEIGPTLAALAPGLKAGLIHELILSDGGSSDDIATIADHAGACLLTGPTGRGRQLAAGARAAGADWLLFLHADTRLAKDWASAVSQHLPTGKAGYFRLRFDHSGPGAALTARWANLRSRVFGLPYGDQGLLIPRKLYDQTGGYADIPLMEDVAMARNLRGHLLAINATATTSAARYVQNGWGRQGARNLWRLTRYLAGASPESLSRRY